MVLAEVVVGLPHLEEVGLLVKVLQEAHPQTHLLTHTVRQVVVEQVQQVLLVAVQQVAMEAQVINHLLTAQVYIGQAVAAVVRKGQVQYQAMAAQAAVAAAAVGVEHHQTTV